MGQILDLELAVAVAVAEHYQTIPTTFDPVIALTGYSTPHSNQVACLI